MPYGHFLKQSILLTNVYRNVETVINNALVDVCAISQINEILNKESRDYNKNQKLEEMIGNQNTAHHKKKKMCNKENANNINLKNSNLEHTSRLHNETLKAKHEDVEKLSEEIAEKFYFHQLFDIGDILGVCGVVVLLKLFKKDPINSIPNSTFYIFIGELIVELVCECVFSLILSPIVRKVTDMKSFESSRSARKIVTTNAVYFCILLTITYPLVLYSFISIGNLSQ